MCIPSIFEVNHKTELFSFIESHAFGQLISSSKGRLTSSHLPFLLSEDKSKLYAHVAKQNPQYLDLDDQEALVTFSGPHDYISPSWYHSMGVPTWNYQAVHVYGRCTTFRDPEKLSALVNSLTEKYEQSQQKPWQAEFPSAMLAAIVGIEIEISDVQGKYKLSQNRSNKDRTAVIEQLKSKGTSPLAEAMSLNITVANKIDPAETNPPKAN